MSKINERKSEISWENKNAKSFSWCGEMVCHMLSLRLIYTIKRFTIKNLIGNLLMVDLLEFINNYRFYDEKIDKNQVLAKKNKYVLNINFK